MVVQAARPFANISNSGKTRLGNEKDRLRNTNVNKINMFLQNNFQKTFWTLIGNAKKRIFLSNAVEEKRVCNEKFDLVCEQKMVFLVGKQKNQRKISMIAAINL